MSYARSGFVSQLRVARDLEKSNNAHKTRVSTYTPTTMTKANNDSKGQRTLAAFFRGGSPKETLEKKSEKGEASKEPSDDSDNAYDDEPEVSDDDITPVQLSKVDGKIESSSLPPIHDIPAMFSDLVSRVPPLKGVAEHVQGRKLRVATMCSGTESPLLALEMICQSIKDHYGVGLEFDHVFSCEIEPFKQAYIERNFKPPLLFRDVCELGEDEAYVLISIHRPSGFT